MPAVLFFSIADPVIRFGKNYLPRAAGMAAAAVFFGEGLNDSAIAGIMVRECRDSAQCARQRGSCARKTYAIMGDSEERDYAIDL